MIPAKYWSPTRKLMLLGAMAGGKAVEDTATGNPLTFQTDLARPLKSLLIPFTPQQEGTGDPSPQNIRSILPWNGLTVFGGGKNLFDASAVIRRDSFLLNDNGVEQASSSSGYTLNRTKVKAGAVYTINGTIVKGAETCRLYFYNGDTFVSRTSSINVGAIPYTFTVPQNCDGIAIQYNMGTVDFSTIQLEVGQTASAYEPYKPITETDIVFPSPVYGGTLDVVSGVLTVEWARIALNGTEANWSNYNQWTSFSVPIIGMTTDNYKTVFCDRFAQIKNITSFGVYASASNDYAYFINATDIEGVTDLASWKAYLAENPMGFAYELATPQEIQLTPAQITAIKGENTVWSDANGSMTATFLKKK